MLAQGSPFRRGSCLSLGCVLLAVIALAAFASAKAPPNQLYGVAPDSPFLRSAGQAFRCSESGAQLAWSRFNDDFCDCADGRDEPGTSACAGSGGRFWCANKAWRGRAIPAARVNDGVCDCCDGSDEYAGAACPDRCPAEREQALSSTRAERDRTAAGLAVRQKYAAEAAAGRAAAEQELKALREELQHERDAQAALDERKRQAERDAAAARAAVSDLEKLEEEKRKAAEPQPAGDAPAPSPPPGHSEPPPHIDDPAILAAYYQARAEEQQEHPPAEHQAHEAQPPAPDSPELAQLREEQRAAEEGGPAPDAPLEEHYEHEHEHDLLHPPHQHDHVHDHDHDHDHAHDHDHDHAHDHDHDHEHAEPEAEVAEEEEDEDDEEDDGSFTSGMRQLWRWLTGLFRRRPAPRRVQPRQAEAGARRQADSSSAKVRELEGKVDALVKKLGADLGPDSVYWPLYEKCFSLQADQYRYELCLFNFVNQHSTSLGRFERWQDGHARQSYTNGLSCWQGPMRSTQVDLVCGDSEKLLEVSEPAKCEYLARFQTPAACDPAQLAALDHTLQN